MLLNVKIILNFDNSIPLDFTEISKCTQVDPVLSKIYEYVITGWPTSIKDDTLIKF